MGSHYQQDKDYATGDLYRLVPEDENADTHECSHTAMKGFREYKVRVAARFTKRTNVGKGLPRRQAWT